jgi:CRP/FNR family transcriptional regulator, cyclic AMP receptor protein
MDGQDTLFERIVLLKNVPFFELLRTDQLRHLAAALEPIAWPGREVIFERGEAGDAMYIIVSGKVGISLDETPSFEDFIVELGPDEFFGEMAILDDQPRSASAVSVEGTEAYSLSKDKTRGLLLAYPELGTGMLRALSRRLRTNSQLLDKYRAELAELKK